MVKVYSIDGVTPVVDPSAYVHPTAVLIGDVIIGPDCYIGPCASIRADFGQFTMGRGSNFQDNCTSHSFAGGMCIWGSIVILVTVPCCMAVCCMIVFWSG